MGRILPLIYFLGIKFRNVCVRSGGFSVVRKATELSTGRAVAVKIVKRDFAQLELLEREIAIMNKVKGHESILDLYDVFRCKHVGLW